MPTIINPYGNQQTMGQDLFGIGGIADAFFGPKASQSAFTREKFKEQQRQNLGVEDLANLLQNPNAAPGAMAAAAARGGVTSDNLGGYNRFGVVGRAPDIRDPSVARSVLQAGGNYAITPEAFDINQANEVRKQQIASDKAYQTAMATADNTPISVRMPTPEDPNRTVITSRSNAIKNGLTPVLSATEAEGTIRLGGFPSGYKDFNAPQLRAGGVAPTAAGQPSLKNIVITEDATGKSKTYTSADGVTSVDGVPIPAGPGFTKQVVSADNPTAIAGLTSSPDKTELRTSRIATATANDLIDRMTANLAKSGADASLGPMGAIASFGNQFRAQLEAAYGVSQELGFNRVAGMFDSGAKNLVSSSPGLQGLMQRLNIQRGTLESQISSLAYAIAKSDNPSGQIGVRDVEKAMATIGGTIQDPVAFTAVLKDVKERMNAHQAIRERVIGQGASPAARQALDIGNPVQSGGAPAAPVDRAAVDNALKLYGGGP